MDTTNRQKTRAAVREVQRNRVVSLRSRSRQGQGVRSDRLRSRLSPASDSLFGHPSEHKPGIDKRASEMYYRSTNQAVTTSTWEAVEYDTSVHDSSRLGYAAVYDTTTFKWTIPARLDGLWRITALVTFASNATGRREARVFLNATTAIWNPAVTTGTTGAISIPVNLEYVFAEGDSFSIGAWQNSGGDLNLNGGAELNHATVTYLGRVS